MNTLMRTVIGIFIILHGLVHPSWPWCRSQWKSKRPTRRPSSAVSGPPPGCWAMAPTVKTLIYVLSVLVALVLIAAGIGFIGAQPWTQIVWLSGAGLSLLLIIVFWNSWLVIGTFIDLALLAMPFATTWLSA